MIKRNQMTELMPPLNPLHVFEVAARLGSFTKAAEKMRVTQPAVSRQIRTLENFLGVQLFERDRHGVRLTPMGEQFHRQVAPAFRIDLRGKARKQHQASPASNPQITCHSGARGWKPDCSAYLHR